MATKIPVVAGALRTSPRTKDTITGMMAPVAEMGATIDMVPRARAR
jgi:hypothetical protein